MNNVGILGPGNLPFLELDLAIVKVRCSIARGLKMLLIRHELAIVIATAVAITIARGSEMLLTQHELNCLFVKDIPTVNISQ